MMLNTDYFSRCIATLNQAFAELQHLSTDDLRYDIYRAACVKEFEIIVEQTAKLLKKCLAEYFVSHQYADRLNFKDVFRHAAKHGLVEHDAVERWFAYLDNRNNTAHDYGEGFANHTLVLLPQFIVDATYTQHRIMATFV